MASSDEEFPNVEETKPEEEGNEELPEEGEFVSDEPEQEAENIEEPEQTELGTVESEEHFETMPEEPAENIETESQPEAPVEEQPEERLSFFEEGKEEIAEEEEEEAEVTLEEIKELEPETEPEIESEQEQEQVLEQPEEEKELPQEEQEIKQEEEVAAAAAAPVDEVLSQDEGTEGYEVASDRHFDPLEDAQSAVLEDTEEGVFRKFQPSGEPEGEEEPVVSPEPLLGTVDLTDVSLKPTEVPTTTIVKERESLDFMEESFWEPRRRDRTIFSERCQRGDYPFRLVQTPQGVTLEWVLAVKDLDYRYYLPEFIRGLKEPDARFLAIANLCVHDMIATDKNKVKMALPYIMNDLYDALSSRFPAICINACKVLQKLAKVVGKQLGFYFDRLFGILNTMRLRIEYIEGQKSFIKHRDMSLHPLYEEILTTWCRLQDILSRIREKELQRMMRYWIRPLPWLTF